MSHWAAAWWKIAERMTKILNAQSEDYNTQDGDLTVYRYTDNLRDARLVSSKLENGRHILAVDIDMPAALVPSSTKGHYHLYIDHEMTWTTYTSLLMALAEAGIVEPGYADASIRRGATHLRTPWNRKTDGNGQPKQYLP